MVPPRTPWIATEYRTRPRSNRSSEPDLGTGPQNRTSVEPVGLEPLEVEALDVERRLLRRQIGLVVDVDRVREGFALAVGEHAAVGIDDGQPAEFVVDVGAVRASVAGRSVVALVTVVSLWHGSSSWMD